MINDITRKVIHGTHDLLFRTVHGRSLIYNTSWEDPRIDRQLLGLNADSRVVMLTSAGCNALDYLLDSPAEIHAVDVNPRQNALLQLKLALIERGDFEDLFAMFGTGSHAAFRDIYAQVRMRLTPEARTFWDSKIVYFSQDSKKQSFYYYGTSGIIAWLLSRYLLKHPVLCTELMNLLEARTLADQREIYGRIEPMIWGRFVSWIVRQPLTLAMLGVPRPQIRLINEQFPGGVLGYVSAKLRHVATDVLMHDNYFWRVYTTGSYTNSCCPNYLKQENFELLQSRADRVHVHNASVTEFLRQHPGKYSHFVLLDHQDWLAQHDPVALAEEWALILANSAPGSRILMRSAGQHVDFLPQQARSKLRFFPEVTESLHLQDRVGTYGSLHFAEVT